MAQASKLQADAALVPTLPAQVFTRSGSSLDPREDVWAWTDGPFSARLDFRRLQGGLDGFIQPLKQSLLPFLKGHSSSHVSNLFVAFVHLLDCLNDSPGTTIGVQHISDYAATLKPHEVGRLGTLNVLLQKWVRLNLPGVDPECATYLVERRKPGNRKGDAVRTRDPVDGPFSEDEYTALYSAVNAAYGKGELPLWVLLLTRLLLACGGRISQFAALKVKDFDGSTFALSLPQAKTREVHARKSFLQFDISPQTGRLILDHFAALRERGHDDNAAFFPEAVVMARGSRRAVRKPDDLFYGHCIPAHLASNFKNALEDIAPPTERLDFLPIPLTTKRFRYTFGTRMAEEGASQMLIANRMGHVDLQQVHVYVSASPKIVENLDKTMGALLAPLAAVFTGRLVENEEQTTHKGAPGSRIIDFRVSAKPVGSCAGKGSGCAFNKPVACYSCFRFEPWLDAPHEKILERLQAERETWASDARMAAVNDVPIRAVKEVISLCAEALKQRAETGAKP